MNNAELYHFDDFTLYNYRRLLRIAKQNYTFRMYSDFSDREKVVLWRHDVDFSVHSARNLSQIEAEEGVKSTYFLYLHSEFYNLMEQEITKYVHDIIALGHHVGLHFNCGYYNVQDEEKLEKFLLIEKRILEEIFGQQIHAFSFHIPTPFTMNCRKWQYGGMINTYAEYFQKEVGYCSDSNGYWRFRRLEEVLQEAKDNCLQILTHPVWWQRRVMSPKKRLNRCVDGRAEKTKEWYDRTVKAGGRENVDWE